MYGSTNFNVNLTIEKYLYFFFQTTITILIARRLAIRPCAFYPTVSAPKTVPEYQMTYRPKKCLKWSPSLSTMPSTTITLNCTKKYSMANVKIPTVAISKPLSSCRTNTPIIRPSKRPTEKVTKSLCIPLRE